jgi:signal transduction histidine kinase
VASLNLASHTVDAVGVSSRNAIEAIAAQIGPAIARAKAETALHLNEKNLQALVSKLVVAEENERRRIAHGLHDDINQMLATAKLTLGHIAALLRRKETRDMVFKVNGYIDHVLQGTRSLTFDLASPVLQRFGLEAAVEDLCGKMTEQHGISFVFKNDKASKPLSGEIEIVVFHAVRELLRNIVDHAGARHVTVSLHRAGKHLVVAVRDDGVGFSLSKVNGFNRKGGFGLYTIRERMKHLGGSFSSEAVSPCGTRLVLSVPLGLAARKVPRGGIRVKKAHFS